MQLSVLGRRAASSGMGEAAAKEREDRIMKRKRYALAQQAPLTQLARREQITQVQPVVRAARSLQGLVDASYLVFPTGSQCDTVPPPRSVKLIRRLIAEIGPEDVGLKPDSARYFKEMKERGAQPTSAITTKTLYECDTFAVSVFFLFPGKVMPLHDHPRMTVISKILLGSARVTSYDWMQPSLCLDRRWLLAQKVRDEDMTAESEAWVLYPSTGGNVQRLAATADGPCALIQVLSPPRGSRLQHNIGYDFYKDMPCEQIHPAVLNQISDEQKGQLAWLQQTGVPKDLNLLTLRNNRDPVIL